jgi:predicted nucleic acid-binding protein
MKEKKNDLRVLIDTGVWLKLFLGEEGKEEVRELLLKVSSGKIKAFVSVVTLAELVTICIRRKKEFLIPTILEFIHQNCILIDTTPEIATLAGCFKAKYSTKKATLSHADSAILTCAFVYSCILLTYDPEFDGIQEIKVSTPERYLE